MSKGDKKQGKLSAESLKIDECIAGWIDKLSTHFGSPQDQEQINIYLAQLKNFTVYQLDIAFEKCLNTCEYMPRLTEIRKHIPEERYPEHRRPFVQQKPILNEIQPIAQEICKSMTGREYDELDATDPADNRLIFKVFWFANRLRYQRMNIDTSMWPQWEAKDDKWALVKRKGAQK